MFTGLIEDVGRVKFIRTAADSARLVVECRFAGELAPGDSVAVDGVCLTVTETGAGEFSADALATTLAKTTLAGYRRGRFVNLERALTADGRLDGHMVQGHVGGSGRLLGITRRGSNRLMKLAVEAAQARELVREGSVAVDGISLTVAELGSGWARISVIPHTWDHTALPYRRTGESLNIETDILLRGAVQTAPAGERRIRTCLY